MRNEERAEDEAERAAPPAGETPRNADGSPSDGFVTQRLKKLKAVKPAPSALMPGVAPGKLSETLLPPQPPVARLPAPKAPPSVLSFW